MTQHMGAGTNTQLKNAPPSSAQNAKPSGGTSIDSHQPQSTPTPSPQSAQSPTPPGQTSLISSTLTQTSLDWSPAPNGQVPPPVNFDKDPRTPRSSPKKKTSSPKSTQTSSRKPKQTDTTVKLLKKSSPEQSPPPLEKQLQSTMVEAYKKVNPSQVADQSSSLNRTQPKSRVQ